MIDTNNSLLEVDRFFQYVPFVRNVTNLFTLFYKTVILPLMNQMTRGKNYCYKYLNQKGLFCRFLNFSPIKIDPFPDQRDGLAGLPLTEMISLLKQLPLKENPSEYRKFVYCKEDEIASRGGICLTPAETRGGYRGIVVCQEEDAAWILHLCPGGGNLNFCENDFNRMMKIVAKELLAQSINPTAFVVDGRHPKDTLQNFQKWQKNV